MASTRKLVPHFSVTCNNSRHCSPAKPFWQESKNLAQKKYFLPPTVTHLGYRCAPWELSHLLCCLFNSFISPERAPFHSRSRGCQLSFGLTCCLLVTPGGGSLRSDFCCFCFLICFFPACGLSIVCPQPVLSNVSHTTIWLFFLIHKMLLYLYVYRQKTKLTFFLNDGLQASNCFPLCVKAAKRMM